MRPGDAVMELTRMGFSFRLDNEAVKVRFEGKQTPDPVVVSRLFDLVRQHRDEVRYFLRSYCPRCGGVVFCPDYQGRVICMACNWGKLVEIYPDFKVRH